jgi:hypothetical protein
MGVHLLIAQPYAELLSYYTSHPQTPAEPARQQQHGACAELPTDFLSGRFHASPACSACIFLLLLSPLLLPAALQV